MTKRDALLAYLRRETRGPLPWDMGFNPGAEKEHANRLAGKSERECFDCPTRDVRPDVMKAKREFDFSVLYPQGLPPNSFVDEWGIATQVSENGLVHVISPMADFEEASELEDYPFPDYTNPACYAEMTKQVEAVKAQGLVAVAKVERLIFAMGRDLRGYENHMTDYYINEEFNEALLNRILECQLQLVQGMAASGADILWLSSDVASQDNVFIDPNTYHRTVAWRMRALYTAAKAVNPNILCAYHCCGNVVPIMEDILDFGIHILNPLQPESLDFPSFKKTYGDKLILWGGISVQHVLPHGSREEVRRAVREATEVLGRGGGYVVSPCNEVTEDIPWENLEALVEEARAIGERWPEGIQ